MKKVLFFLCLNFLFLHGTNGAVLNYFPDQANGNDSGTFSNGEHILVNGQDTVIFDFSNAFCTNGYMQVPVRFNSDELIYSMDFALHFNPGIFSYISIVNHQSYLTYAATYNNADSTLRFSSYSFQPMDNNTNLISVRFSLPASQIDFAQFDSVYTLLNGDICSSKAIPYISPAVITSGGPTTIFPGDSLELSISPLPGLTYLWSNGETDSSIVITSPGIYSVNTFFPNGCNSISSIMISPPDPLPVELVDFITKVQENVILISWSTASETNNSYFIPEHSVDGLSWKELGRVEGAGNSNTARFYSFIDQQPDPGYNYYRLKQVDFNGYYAYSEISCVKFEGDESDLSISVYPNPVCGNEVNVNFKSVIVTTQMEISLINSNGKLVSKSKLLIEPGLSVNKKILINSNEAMPGGLYFMFFKSNEDELVQKVFIK